MESLGRFSKKITKHHLDKSSINAIDGTNMASTFNEFLRNVAVDLATCIFLKQCGASVKDNASQALMSHKSTVLVSSIENLHT